jgi:hypothetical protein
MGILPKIF